MWRGAAESIFSPFFGWMMGGSLVVNGANNDLIGHFNLGFIALIIIIKLLLPFVLSATKSAHCFISAPA